MTPFAPVCCFGFYVLLERRIGAVDGDVESVLSYTPFFRRTGDDI
jgi:hypothetical protein